MVTRASTQTKLLDAADELFFTRGVTATPVDDVLARAGVSPATLYRAYGSKEGLVAAALDRRHRDWLGTWDDVLEHATDDRGRLLAVFDALERFQSRPDGARWCAFLGTAAEYAAPPPALAAAIQQDTDALRERLTSLARPLAGPRAPALADALTLLISGQLAMRLRHRDPDGPPTTAPLGVARDVARTLVDQTVADRAPSD